MGEGIFGFSPPALSIWFSSRVHCVPGITGYNAGIIRLITQGFSTFQSGWFFLKPTGMSVLFPSKISGHGITSSGPSSIPDPLSWPRFSRIPSFGPWPDVSRVCIWVLRRGTRLFPLSRLKSPVAVPLHSIQFVHRPAPMGFFAPVDGTIRFCSTGHYFFLE